MAIIKCKMCGGDLNITEGLSVAECEYCGSRQTIPTADNEKKMTLFNRAGRLLRGCEFDKAAGVFESIVADFPEEAEAYWGLVLCRFGIEYVDDPATGKKVPTCHRSSFDSVMDDPNFEQACEFNDAVARRVYRDEARQIEELRKAIIEVSGREEPYDLFISYKETDENGQRTLDSVIAQDIYDALTEAGYRVFFSRISLEDKLGVEYEPYIFAALNSAKLMLVVGTDYENFDAVWVKNEWSRFLKLMTQDKSKHLIPVFKNMDAYDMPKEFAKLSAQDMGKLGAMQDLLRGVEKMLGTKKAPVEEKRETVIIQQSSGGPNVQAMIDRGNMALEDSKWEDATGFFNRALDMDAKCAEAYFGLFLANKKCSSAKQFVDTSAKELEHVEYETLQAGTEDVARIKAAIKDFALQGYLSGKTIEGLFAGFNFSYKSCLSYREAQHKKQHLFLTDRNYIRAEQFASGQLRSTILGMKDSVLANAQKCIDEARAADAATINRINAKYLQFVEQAESRAKTLYAQALAQRDAEYLAACTFGENAKAEGEFFEAANRFSSIKLMGYKDSAQLIKLYNQKGEELKNQRITKENAEKARLARLAAEEAERKRIADEQKKKEQQERNKKLGIIAVIAAVIAVAAFFAVKTVVIPANEYKAAEALYAEGRYTEALAAFDALGGYKDSALRTETIANEIYANAEKLMANGEYGKAAIIFSSLGNYKDATTRNKELWTIMGNSGLWHTISTSKNLTYLTTVCLKFYGTVEAVGDNRYGQRDVHDWKDIVAVSTGDHHTVGLKTDGTVVAVGDNVDGRCNVSDWKDIVAVSAGDHHTVGLKSDGTVVAVGDNRYGQCDVHDWKDIVAVSAGAIHTVGLKSDGSVVAVGDNEYGRSNVHDWKDIVAVSAGGFYTVGLKTDGTVLLAGPVIRDVQRHISSWTNIKLPEA